MKALIDTLANATVGAAVCISVALMGGPMWAGWAAGAVVYMIHTAADRIIACIRGDRA